MYVVDYKPFSIRHQVSNSERLQEQPSSFIVNLFGFGGGFACVVLFVCFFNVLSCLCTKSFLNVFRPVGLRSLLSCAPELKK